MQNPFSLIRHGLSYAKFDAADTRNTIVNLVDALEAAVDNLSDTGSELNTDFFSEEMAELKEHLTELLEANEEKVLPNEKDRISLGEVTDEDEE